MSAAAFDLGLQLRALHESTAIPRLAYCGRVLHPDARVVAPLGMAGDDSVLWAIAVAPVGRRAETFIAADPQDWSSQGDLWSWVGERLGPWARWHADQGTHPQLVVADTSTLSLLTTAARARTGMGDTARRGVTLVAAAVYRADRPGQDSVIAVAELADEQWAWGTPPSTLDDRAAWLAGTVPEPGPPRPAAHIDPQIEGALVAPVRRHRATRRQGASGQLTELRAATVAAVLRPAVAQQVTAINTLWGHLAGLEALDAAGETCTIETRAWQHDATRTPAAGPATAARLLAELEEVTDTWQRAQLWGDPLEWERARADGTVLAGTLTPIGAGRGLLHTAGPTGRARPGTHLVDRGRGLQVTVTALVAGGAEVTVTGGPPEGPVDLGPEPPNWARLNAARINTARRLRTPAWTHRDGPAPSPDPQALGAGGDRLAAINALRSPE